MQYTLVALPSLNDWEIIRGIINRNILEVDFEESQVMVTELQGELRLVIQYTEPVSTIQTVCDHQAQIIALQKEITNLKLPRFLPP
jgi:hypothetical protein